MNNMGLWDRVIRMLVGTSIILLYILGMISGWVGVIGMGIAALLLFFSFLGTCPLYLPFGFSTMKRKHN